MSTNKRVSRYSIYLVLLFLTACGGGGGSGNGGPPNSPPTPNPDTTDPVLPAKAITLGVSTQPEKISVAWLPATDDISPASDITYALHVGNDALFAVSSNNEVARYTGVVSGDAMGLTANTSYFVKVVAIDQAGNTSSPSDPLVVLTAKNPVSIKPGSYRDPISVSSVAPTENGNSFTFVREPTSQLPSAGEIIVGSNSTGDYYLRRIDNVQSSSASVVVQTSDAGLSDVVERGVLSSNIVLREPLSNGSTTPKGMQIRARRGDSSETTENIWENGILSSSQADFAQRVSNRSVNPIAGRTTYQTQTAGNELTLTSDIAFEPSIVTYAEFSPITGLDNAEIYAQGDFSLDSVLAYNFSGSIDIDETLQIFERKYRSVYSLGPVPVEQVIKLSVEAQFTANAQTAIDAQSNANLSTKVRFGMRYQNGQWSLIDEKSVDRSLTITATIQGQVTAEVRLIPTIEVTFYRAATAGLSVEPYLTGAAAAEAVANANILGQSGFATYRFTQLDASLGVDANVYGELKILSQSIARFPAAPNSSRTVFALSYPLFSLPEFALTTGGVPQLSGSSYTLEAMVTDGVNNAFDYSSISWIAVPSGTITQDPNNPLIASFTPDQTGVDYSLYFIGNGQTIGSVGRQYEVASVSFTDADSDGIPNAWELAYGLNINDPFDALSNPDGDGFSNLEEYQNGTDPNIFDAGGTPIPLSPQNVAVAAGDSQILVTWDASQGATSHNVYIAQEQNITAANVNTLAGGQSLLNVTSPYTIAGLANDTTYYAVLTAQNSSGESSESIEVSATPVEPAPPVDLTQGLVVHYAFENNTNDMSVNGLDGTQSGGVSYTAGVNGLAANFDGLNDYISSGYVPSLSQTDSISFSFWYRNQTPNDQRGSIFGYEVTNSSQIGAWINDASGNQNTSNRFGATFRDITGTASTAFSPSDADQNTWHHAVVIRDATNRTVDIFIDGTLVTTLPDVTIDNINFSNSPRQLSLAIGASDNSSRGIESYFRGQIDEYRIYNRVLNDSEIQALSGGTPQAPSIAGQVTTGASVNSLDIASSGNAAYVVSQSQLCAVDVTMANTPTVTNCQPVTNQIGYDVVLSPTASFAYVASGTGGLSVFDISNPSLLAFVTNVSATNEVWQTADISIDGNTVVVGASTSGVRVVDVTTPDSPLMVESTGPTGASVNAELSNNNVFLSHTNLDNTGNLFVADISTPSSLSFLGSISTLAGSVDVAISPDGNTAYVTLSSSGLQIIDVTTPATPASVGSLSATNLAGKIALSPNGQFVYVADGDGLQIVDVSNSTSPAVVDRVSIPDGANDVVLSSDGSFAYVATNSGLVVIEGL